MFDDNVDRSILYSLNERVGDIERRFSDELKMKKVDCGECTIKGGCYQDFIGILLSSHYTVKAAMTDESTFYIKYWREL